MNPDNTKLSDCHDFVTDSTNPAEIRCCCCGQICTWHAPAEQPKEDVVPVSAIPISETVKTTTHEVKKPVEPPSSQEMSTDDDFNPRHEREFEKYRHWRNASPLAVNQSDETLVNMGFDADAIETLKIRSQKEFAEKYGLSEATMTRWNKVLDENKFEDRFAWAKHLSKNMIMALYRSALKKGSADQIKAWFQIVEGWVPTTETKIDDNRETTKLRNKLFGIMDEWTDDDSDKGIGDGGAS